MFITVLKMMTDNGSPWKTPSWRWMGAVDDCCEDIIEVGDQLDHLRRGMVVGKRERNEVMMNTAKRICQVQPADTEGLASFQSLPKKIDRDR